MSESGNLGFFRCCSCNKVSGQSSEDDCPFGKIQPLLHNEDPRSSFITREFSTCLLPLFPSSDHCYVLPHSCNALHGCGKLLQDKPADGRAAFTWDHSRRVRTLATMIVLPVLASLRHADRNRECLLIGVTGSGWPGIKRRDGPVADIDLHKTTLLSHQISFF